MLTRFAQVDDPVQLYQKILSQSERGWKPYVKSTDADAWAVWNNKPDTERFLSDSVRWAHLFYDKVADNLRFSIGQQVRVVGEYMHPKKDEVRGLIGIVDALPSSDEQPAYGVSFPEKGVWSIPQKELEAID